MAPTLSHAGRISTWLEGKVIHKTDFEWVIENQDGTYWISVIRPVSWLTKMDDDRFGFWVHVEQIKRFSPKEMSAQ